MKDFLLPWLKTNKYWIAAIVLILVGIATKMGISSYNDKQFLSMRQEVDKYLKEKKNPQNVALILTKKTSFENTYGSFLSQQFLENGHVKEAKQLSQNAISRLNENLPLYALFSTASLLIYENNYEQALTLSEKLNEMLQNDTNSSLALYNTRRIAGLQKILHKQITVLENLKTFNLNEEELKFFSMTN